MSPQQLPEQEALLPESLRWQRLFLSSSFRFTSLHYFGLGVSLAKAEYNNGGDWENILWMALDGGSTCSESKQCCYVKLFRQIPRGHCSLWLLELRPFQWDMAKLAIGLFPYSVQYRHNYVGIARPWKSHSRRKTETQHLTAWTEP